MNHFIFGEEQRSYEVAILIKDAHFTQDKIEEHYIAPLKRLGIKETAIIAFNLPYDKKKVSNKHATAYLDKLVPVLDKLGVKLIYCADADYFKVLTKQKKADPCLGYVMPCAMQKLNHIQVTLGINYGGLIYNPNLSDKLDLSLDFLASHYKGSRKILGSDIIQHEEYPCTDVGIKRFLDSLHQYPTLTCDIETFSLELFEAGIGSISFAWNKHEGGGFMVDYYVDGKTHTKGIRGYNFKVRELLREFFRDYKGKVIYHNGAYDIKVLILELFMKHPQDFKGMMYGLDLMTKDMEDTKVIAYLALNNTADTSLSLKELAHEYAGNYAQSDIKDIRLIPYKDLLRYNLTDCLSTWYVYEKYVSKMEDDNQRNIYEEIMKPSIKILLQIELVGMPIDMVRVLGVEKELETIKNTHLLQLQQSPSVMHCQNILQLKELTAINSKLKTKQHGLAKVSQYLFNPNSNAHLSSLLYDVMLLPVIDVTATKQPATGAATLEKLINHTQNQEYKDTLATLIGWSKVTKILSAFIPAFKNAKQKKDGMWYLHASFNLNGTLSGRLSCSNPK